MSESAKITRRKAIQYSAAAGLGLSFGARAVEQMTTREIPGTGESLPVIGLGTWTVFDIDNDPEALEVREDILAALFEAGGSVIDSSPMYNRSERVVGDVLAAGGFHDRAFLATKVWIDGEDAGVRQMNRSAELMRTDVVDLMQVHNRRDMDAHWPTIQAMQEDGRVRYNGVTDYRESAMDAMAAIMRRYRPEFIQINYSLGERAADQVVLPLAQELGIGVLINRPFMEGRLFRAVSGQELPGWATDFADSWGQFFLKFIVSHPAVTCVIPGTSKVRHMADNAGAGSGPLPDKTTRQRMIEFMASV